MSDANVLSESKLQVRFYIELANSIMAKEASSELASWPVGKIGLDDLFGQWAITGGDLHQPVVLEDDLINLGYGLGIDGTRAIRAKVTHEMKFDASPDGVRLEPEGEVTKLFVSDQFAGSLNSARLAEELLACTARLAKTLRHLAGQDENVIAAAEALAERCSAAYIS